MRKEILFLTIKRVWFNFFGRRGRVFSVLALLRYGRSLKESGAPLGLVLGVAVYATLFILVRLFKWPFSDASDPKDSSGMGLAQSQYWRLAAACRTGVS